MTSERRLRPDRPARRTARSVAEHLDAEHPLRPAVPHDRHDRGRAVPRAADRRAARAPGFASRPARGGDPNDTRGGRPSDPDRLRHVRTCRAGRRGDPARGGAGAGLPNTRSCRASRRSSYRLRHLPAGWSSGSATKAARRRPTRPSARHATAGRSTAVITVSRRSPAGALAGIIVETEELDHGWCHTVGYLSPIVAAASVGAHLSGRPLDADAVEGLITAGTRDESGAERIAAAIADAAEPPRDRLGRRPSGWPRAGPQGRGGVLAAVGVPGPGDVPARAPAGHRRHDRPRPDPDRSRAVATSGSRERARRWRRHGSSASERPRSSRPRSTRPSIATSRPPVASSSRRPRACPDRSRR